MSLPEPLPEVRPISDLRTRLSEIETYVHETQQPLVLTRNGKSSLVILDSEVYDEQLRTQRALLKLREAEIEARYRPESICLADSRARVDSIIASAETRHA